MNYPSDEMFEEARRNPVPPGFKRKAVINSYQDVIDYVRKNMEYYESHTHSCCEDFQPGIMARGSAMALQEVLEHFNENFIGHKLACNGGGLNCKCGLSQFTITRIDNRLAYYECKCGNKWTDDEYPGATYCTCPSCHKDIE